MTMIDTRASHTTPFTGHRFSVLFLCMGNICRSPTAHGVFRQKVQQAGLADAVFVTSAGTHNYHPGDPPDQRSQRVAADRGYDLSDLRARQLSARDFEQHDLLLAMDWDNLALAEQRCPPAYRRKLRRLTEFCRRHEAAVVPDPYYGGDHGFQHVLDLIEDACDGLLEHVSCQLVSPNAVIHGGRG
ncbi:MAG: low molecular weight protein-tyrosine-phosphatase [Burkholderiaceae bacterium]